jgi:hypothetical protein
METRKILKFIDFSLRIVQVITLLSFFVYVGILIHSAIAKKAYINNIVWVSSVNISIEKPGIEYIYDKVNIPPIRKVETYIDFEKKQKEKRLYNPSKFATSTRIILIAKSLFNTLLFILILQNIINLIRSVRSLSTFKNENSRTCKKIAYYYGLLFILLNIPTYISTISFENNIAKFHNLYFFDFKFDSSILFCMVFFLFFLVFKEGSKLKEETDLTI